MTYFSSIYSTRPNLIELLIRRQLNCKIQAIFSFMLYCSFSHLISCKSYLFLLNKFYATTTWRGHMACYFQWRSRCFEFASWQCIEIRFHQRKITFLQKNWTASRFPPRLPFSYPWLCYCEVIGLSISMKVL